MDERASASEICLYYARVLRERLLDSGRVSFYPNCDYIGEGRFVSQVSGSSSRCAAPDASSTPTTSRR